MNRGSMRTEDLRECPEGPISLAIRALPDIFEASASIPGSGAIETGWGETHFLSTEMAGGFTGIFAAMYATSETGAALPASFGWFDYEPIIGHSYGPLSERTLFMYDC